MGSGKQSILLLLCIVIACTGCGGGGNNGSDSGTAYQITYTAGGVGSVQFKKDATNLWYTGFDVNGGSNMILPFATHSSPLYYVHPQVGQTWTSTGTENGIPVQSSTTIASISESVTVPAGSFTSCVKTVETLTIQTSDPNFPTKCERWFAPGIGPVRVVSTYPDASTRTEELSAASVSGASADDYFPLQSGYTWSSRIGTQTVSWKVD